MSAPGEEKRLLIAGIGNVFLGDDGFGVELARRLAGRPWPAGVRVVDFGIRGFDLACALVDGWGGCVLLDAIDRGGPPGTLYVIEPEVPGEPAALEAHGLAPVQVLGLAASLGEVCPWLRLVGCQPLTLGSEEEPRMELSAAVAAAVEEAVELVEELVRERLGS